MCLTHPPAKEPVVQSTPFAVSPQSLADAFADVPDPRRAASVDHPLAAILALTVAAVLSGCRSVLAIAEWGALQPPTLLTALGFPAEHAPCQTTLHRVFRRLDGAALAAALRAHTAPAVPADGLHGVALDGKAQRGRLRFGAAGCPVHALSAVCHESGIVLAHAAIDAIGDKAQAELTVAPQVVDQLAWRHRVLTGDALFCQRARCRQVTTAGGDYLLLVKPNQPDLHDAIALLFDPPADLRPLPLLDQREASTLEHGHGRTNERRHLIASTDLAEYLDWPALAQVFRLERTWDEQGTSHRAVRYGISSLPPARADAATLLALRRGHWTIENRVHRHKDVNLGEDASLIHLDGGPTNLALLRDAALNLLHGAGVRQIAARLRRHAQHPEEAVALVINSPRTHA